MKNKVWKIALVVATFVIVVGVLYVWIGENSENSENKNFFNLKPPSFIGMAGATGTGGGSYFPENEAGMSAYLHPVSSINLEDVKPVFATIDVEESEYIIGTISVDSMTQDEYPYVYVDNTGWIIGYYPREVRPHPSWIVPFGYLGMQTTNPTEAIKKVCEQIGIAFSYDEVGYYDFRFPAATGMTMVMEKGGSTTDYSYITIPESYTVYNISWAYYSVTLYASGGDFNWAKLDGWKFASGSTGSHKRVGYFDETKFAQGVEHKIEVYECHTGSPNYRNSDCRLGIVILYG